MLTSPETGFRRCRHCDGPIEGRKIDALYCGLPCKKRAQRQREQEAERTGSLRPSLPKGTFSTLYGTEAKRLLEEGKSIDFIAKHFKNARCPNGYHKNTVKIALRALGAQAPYRKPIRELVAELLRRSYAPREIRELLKLSKWTMARHLTNLGAPSTDSPVFAQWQKRFIQEGLSR